MKHSATIVLLIMGVAACDDDRGGAGPQCTVEADSDVDCVPRANNIGHSYFYNGHHYSCAWYNHSTSPATTYVPMRSAGGSYARSTPAPARAAPTTTSSRGGFGGTGSGGSS
jgi:hypothetical protein